MATPANNFFPGPSALDRVLTVRENRVDTMNQLDIDLLDFDISRGHPIDAQRVAALLTAYRSATTHERELERATAAVRRAARHTSTMFDAIGMVTAALEDALARVKEAAPSMETPRR